MTKEQLDLRLKDYESEKAALLADTHREEIEARVAEYRAQLTEEYKKNTEEDVRKIDHYIDLLRDLIQEEEDNLDEEAEGDAPNAATQGGVTVA